MKEIKPISNEINQSMNMLNRALNNAAKEAKLASEAIYKLSVLGVKYPVKKPKWWQFWKWDFSLFSDNPPRENGIWQPTIDRTTPPR